MDPLFIVPVSPLIATHFKQHSLAFQCAAGCGVNARLSPKSGKCPYLDAKWCAALEKLLYVVQALAVVFRFLVDLQRRKRRLGIQFQFTPRVPRCSHCGLLSSSALKWIFLIDTHSIARSGPDTLREAGLGSCSGEVEEAGGLGRGKWRRQIEIAAGVESCGCMDFSLLHKQPTSTRSQRRKKRLKLIYPHWF